MESVGVRIEYTGLVDHGVEIFRFDHLVGQGLGVEVEALVEESEVVSQFFLLPDCICSEEIVSFVLTPVFSSGVEVV